MPPRYCDLISPAPDLGGQPPNTAILRVVLMVAFSMFSVGSVLLTPWRDASPTVTNLAAPATTASMLPHTLAQSMSFTPLATATTADPPTVAAVSPSSSSAAASVLPEQPLVPEWIISSVESGIVMILVPVIVMLMWEAAAMLQQWETPGEPTWLMTSSTGGTDDWGPWQKNNVHKKSTLAYDDDSSDSGSESDDSETEDPFGFKSPLLSRVVWRNDKGELVGGWGHKLTEEERRQFQEGDALDDDTINRWADEDEVIPGERTAGSLEKLFARGFTPVVTRDNEDGELYAGFGHRLTAEERQRFKEGDVVDEKTLSAWLSRQILELDMTDDEEEEE